MKIQGSRGDRLGGWAFALLTRRALLFNASWEDPAVDRRALRIGSDDTVLAITSAGCNVLDYALAGPRAVLAVDVNPRQTALLELKMASIRNLDFEDHFALFGEGRRPGFRGLYRSRLRGDLSPFARIYWDRRCRWFEGRGWRGSFYWHGLSGLFARLAGLYAATRRGLPEALRDLLAATAMDEQRRIFEERVEPLLWTRALEKALATPIAASLLGVPARQRRLIETERPGGMAEHVRDSIRRVFRDLPVGENYFWTVYVLGRYLRDRCPAYLRPEGFERLRSGFLDRIRPATATVTEVLRASPGPITRLSLLDHLDWLPSEAIAEEWEAILERTPPRARVIFRSGSARPAFLDSVSVRAPGGRTGRLRDLLEFDEGLALELSARDRVGTYASFHVGEVREGA